MIPKIIHYCWFGENPLPKLAKKCIKSWKKYCPDYELIEWNESNYDIANAPLYVRQAYEAKKWAFVTDYVRLQVVYENGGIYLDTDVEIIKPIEDLLKYDAFFGVQHDNYIATGLGFGAVRGNALVYTIMSDYNDIPFIKEDGSFDMLDCPHRNSHIFLDYGFILNGEVQIINKISVFSTEYFCPMNWKDRQITVTDNTYSIHWYTASWHTKDWHIKQKRLQRDKKREERRNRLKMFIKKIFGEKLYNKIKNIVTRNKNAQN